MKAFLDWDGTIRKGFTIIDWVIFLENRFLNGDNNVTNKINELFASYTSQEINHDELALSTANEYESLIKQIGNINLENVASEFVKEDLKNLYPFYNDLFSFFKRNSFDIYVISGAPIEILKCYQKKFNFEKVYGLSPNRKDEKRNPGTYVVKELISLHLSKFGKPTISIGNSISDIPLLNKAQISICLNSDLGVKKDGVIIIPASPSNLMSIINKQFNELLYK